MHAIDLKDGIRPTRQGKTARDENFPVASLLISSSYRAPILAFYHFARTADDIADDPMLPATIKIAALDRMQAVLLGNHGDDTAFPVASRLREVLAERQLSACHAVDLLRAFRHDATKTRYANWNELMDYCALSAMPVGRFVLDVHGENQATWPASDAICSALQVINHLQDCADDYCSLDRVYLPLDALARHGAEEAMLGATAASPPLRNCIAELAVSTAMLLDTGRGLAAQVVNRRLGSEIVVIQALAAKLVHLLANRDPLTERVHLSRLTAVGVMFNALARRTLKLATPGRLRPTGRMR